MAWSLLTGSKHLFVVAVACILMQLQQNCASPVALPGCPDKCGNVSIPYPFGLDTNGEAGCFRDGFHVICDEDQPYLEDNRVLEINLSQGEVLVQNSIAISCNSNTHNTSFSDPVEPFVQLADDHFTVSSTKNKFTAIGCATIAITQGENEHGYASGCVSFCTKDGIDSSPQCSGMGCCQTSIPRNIRIFETSFLALPNNKSFYSAIWEFSPCSYAFIAEQNWFNFSPSYVNSTYFKDMYGSEDSGVPMVLNWVVGTETCEEANKNRSSYACAATNSVCISSHNGTGYLCNCSPGYEGNPYLHGGCQDINECDYPLLYPCNGKCSNTIGSYDCSCPPGTQSKDPKSAPCTIPLATSSQRQVNAVIGVSISFIVFIVCIFTLLIKYQKRKLTKEKQRLFKQNGGHILYQQILSKQADTVIIFTVEDLKKATNNFDESRELGTGGHSTVYKGILEDNKVVAVKRSKIVNVAETEEFVHEIIILSQINHKNVVRLIGCCLEVEVPILVYEFVPNGTLFQLVHGNHGRPPVSLQVRLKIAQESAEALAYLHLSINRPIVHGDVKSLNILLHDKYMAKVTDFGASRILPKDEVQLMTIVQGTLGYLDPEYLQERRMTDKSDVYSFGVVLLELITGKMAIYSEGPEKAKSLASSFLEAVKEHRVGSILESSIVGVEMEELLQEVAELARQCLRVKGEERPSMTQVADKLKAIRSTWRELLLLKHNETELLIEDSGMASACGLSASMHWKATQHVDSAKWY